MLAAPFRPLYNSISLLSLLLVLRDSHLIFSSISVNVTNQQHYSELWQFILKDHSLGVQDTTTIFQDSAKKSFKRCHFYILRSPIRISPQETKCSVCLCTHVADISYPIFLLNILYPIFPVQHLSVSTVESQWLEHPWDYVILSKIWVVRATEG